MQATVFDGLARDLGEVSTRRSFVHLLGGVALVGGLSWLSGDGAAAQNKKKGNPKKKKKDKKDSPPPPPVDHLPPPPPPPPPCLGTPAVCPAAQTRCPAQGENCFTDCLDLRSDATHCGACDKQCRKYEECRNGSCVCPGQTCANGSCCPAGYGCVGEGTGCCPLGYSSCGNGRCCPNGYRCGGTCGQECCKP
jgi:hypothetical protein